MALPIDRKQEQQADVLGTMLACQVGYDPDGLAQFMKLLIANTGTMSISARRTQSSNSDR